MVVESDADRLAHLVDYGVSVVATVNGVVQPAVTGIFDDAYKEEMLQGDQVVAFRPQVVVRTIDCANWKKSTTTLSINATVWRIHSMQPDGTGITTVKLLASS